MPIFYYAILLISTLIDAVPGAVPAKLIVIVFAFVLTTSANTVSPVLISNNCTLTSVVPKLCVTVTELAPPTDAT